MEKVAPVIVGAPHPRRRQSRLRSRHRRRQSRLSTPSHRFGSSLTTKVSVVWGAVKKDRDRLWSTRPKEPGGPTGSYDLNIRLCFERFRGPAGLRRCTGWLGSAVRTVVRPG